MVYDPAYGQRQSSHRLRCPYPGEFSRFRPAYGLIKIGLSKPDSRCCQWWNFCCLLRLSKQQLLCQNTPTKITIGVCFFPTSTWVPPASPCFCPECVMSTDWSFYIALYACWNPTGQMFPHFLQAAVTLLMFTFFGVSPKKKKSRSF